MSAPGLAWQACLKKTEVKLELLTDIDMLIMFEQGIRGGISQAIHKYAKANNKYMKSYNKDILSPYLMYLDANNLYGWAICKKLPEGEFKSVKRLSIFAEDQIKDYNENSFYGALLEIDIRYPKHLQHLLKNLPFLPERKQLSTQKLATTIADKKKYVVHISVLKQALNHGLILTKVHRAIMFKQEAWLKPYIEMNTKFRTEAENNFEKDFFKLMNNSVFGKIIENVRNH